MFKVNNKKKLNDANDVWTSFTSFSSVSIVDFEHVNLCQLGSTFHKLEYIINPSCCQTIRSHS